MESVLVSTFIALLTCLGCVHSTNGTTRVCYHHVGCFSTEPPFDNADGYYPKDPKDMGTTFRLYARELEGYFQMLDYLGLQHDISDTNFDPSRKTVIFVHGFGGRWNMTYMFDMKDALLRHDDYNMILVGWGEGAAEPNYFQAAANVRMVAKQTKLLIDKLVEAGLDLGDLHLIGHSLGAHLMGAVSYDLEGKVGRISGLDPAEPNFEGEDTLVRLDEGDAIFIDVIHTDATHFNILSGGFGTKAPSGHVDVFLNGGIIQPGCTDLLDGAVGMLNHLNAEFTGFSAHLACSHMRSVWFYIETIEATEEYTAFPCDNFTNFEEGDCLSCGEGGCAQAGFHADESEGRGVFYMNTLAKEPYRGSVYTVELTPSTEQRNHNHGTIFMALVGEDGTYTNFSRVTPMKGELSKRKVHRHVVVFEEGVTTPTAVKVKYVKSDKYFVTAEKDFIVQEIRLMEAKTLTTFHTCGDQMRFHNKAAQTVNVINTPCDLPDVLVG